MSRQRCGAWIGFFFLIGAFPSTARAADSSVKTDTLWPAVQQRLDALKKLEIIEMVTAIANGSQMGPGDGWFHAGQGRYGWKWLADQLDIDKNGKITRQEFAAPSDLFDRLDRNHDGVLDATDFDWSERSPSSRAAGPASMLYSMFDANSNGRVSREEWEAVFKRLTRGKDYFTPDDLREMLAPMFAPPKPGSNSGPTPAVLFKGLAAGELGSFFEGPSIGDQAPDFVLKTHDGKRTVRLSEFRGKKPVVLVFGSFT